MAGSKLKGSNFQIREDYSSRVRLARKNLYLFAQEKKRPFKIRFDKLFMENKQFTYNADTASVVEVK